MSVAWAEEGGRKGGENKEEVVIVTLPHSLCIIITSWYKVNTRIPSLLSLRR